MSGGRAGDESIAGEPHAQPVAGADGDGGEAVEEAVEDAVAGPGDPRAGVRERAIAAPGIGVAPGQGEAAENADGAGREEGGHVVAVDLVDESGLAGLVEAKEAQGEVAAVEEDKPVEAHGEARLVGSADGLRGADDAGAAGDEDALAVGGVEGDRDGGEDRAGETLRTVG